jgi:hypothetical protein
MREMSQQISIQIFSFLIYTSCYMFFILLLSISLKQDKKFIEYRYKKKHNHDISNIFC